MSSGARRVIQVKQHKTNRLAGLPGESRAAAALLLPSMAGLGLFFLVPFIDTIRRSFLDARGQSFIGAEGYASVLGNSAFQLAAANTAKFICVCIPLLLVISLVLALLVRALRPHGGASGRGKLFKTT